MSIVRFHFVLTNRLNVFGLHWSGGHGSVSMRLSENSRGDSSGISRNGLGISIDNDICFGNLLSLDGVDIGLHVLDGLGQMDNYWTFVIRIVPFKLQLEWEGNSFGDQSGRD